MTATLFAQYGGQPAPTSSKPVRVASAGALAANTYASATQTLTANVNGALAAVDNVTLAVGDRVLVKDEVTQTNNGIYVVTSLGGASSKWVFTRADDASSSTSFTAGMLVAVSEGDLSADKVFELTTDGAITLDTSNLTFAEISRGLINSSNMADSGTLFLTVAAGAGGSADDVTIFNAACPFKIRVLDSRFICTAGAAGGRTVTIRSASAGGGSALSDAFSCAATNTMARNAGVPTSTVSKAGSMFLRRSDSAIAGELQIDFIRTA